MIRKNKKDLEEKVAVNRVGWEAIKHNDGWWVGTEKGVTCYADHDLARVALTLVWQRDGGKKLNFRIEKYEQVADKNVAPDYTPIFSAEAALQNYESAKPIQRRRLRE
jgi:hypothetical protein